jgi:Na+-translocating ferredoxin:NAD+ oxidoreductase RnfG subunit
MHIKHLLKTVAILLCIVAIFGVAMFGLNFLTGPIIAENNKGAEFAPLLAVMPDAEGFEDVTATLAGVPESVIAIYKETTGRGYVVRAKASTQYSKEPMELTFGVTADGKICGIQLDVYTDSIDFRAKDASYINSYLEKDSALAEIGIVAGATYSSTAFKNAVAEGFSALITNQLIAEGVKSDAQILEEMIPTLAPGMLKLEEATVSGNIEKAMKAGNGAGFAYVIKSGEASFLALVNASGVCKVYDVAGAEVTEAQAAIADEAKAHAAAAQKSYLEDLTNKVTRLYETATEVTAIELSSFNTVVSAASFKVDGADYYAFYARSYGYNQMDVFVILDANGAIAKLDAKAFFFDEEYFHVDDTVNLTDYKNGFVGQTEPGDNAMIAGATMTSNAVKQATADAFESFKTISGGAQ